MKHTDPQSTPNPSLNTLGERIKAVRSLWNWSQEEMASNLRVDQASISFWERDKIKPSGSAMVALAALFRNSVESLESGQKFQLPDPPTSSDLPKAERPKPRSVSLPTGNVDAVGVVDLATGASNSHTLSEAMMTLAQGVKDGRNVWVVLE